MLNDFNGSLSENIPEPQVEHRRTQNEAKRKEERFGEKCGESLRNLLSSQSIILVFIFVADQTEMEIV